MCGTDVAELRVNTHSTPAPLVIRHYLRTTIRVLTRQLTFSVINLVGLSVGIATAILLLLFVRNEISFDGAHQKADRIYRAWVLEDYGENQQHFNTITPVRTGPDLQAALPEVEAVVRFDRKNGTVRYGEASHDESLYMVDEAFLDVFDFDIVTGQRANLFAAPDNVVLTQSAASRYFGGEEAVGEVLTVDFGDDQHQFQVSGVLADVPENSSLQFELLLPYSVSDRFYDERARSAFFSVSPETYVLLREGASIEEAEAKIPPMLTSLLGDRVEEGQYKVGLQPLLDVHMNTEFPQGYSTVVSPLYVRILLAIALLVLGIACINFVTLSVSRAMGRAREIGIRKAIGANRTQLMLQYWGEALVLTGASLLLGFALAATALPAFNGLAQRELSLAFDFETVLLAIGVFGAVGLLAGLYPAVVLSGFSPVEAFRGKIAGSGNRSRVRQGLVISQFALSILLMASTLIMSRQLDYLQSKDLGFNRESVIAIPTNLGIDEGKEAADRLRFWSANRPDVVAVSSAAMLFDTNGWLQIGYPAADGSYRRHFANVVDFDFVDAMGLRVVQGRNFDRSQPGDQERAVVVNQAFVASHGWSDPLVETIPGEFDEHQIIGVVEDFHFASLHNQIEPALMVLTPNVAFSGAQDVDYAGSFSTDLAVRIAGPDVRGTIAALSEAWAEVAPDSPFTYQFLDESIAAQYGQEERLSDVVTLGAFLAILIAGLGLFGLAAMSVVRRTKEIGLRKVLGANVGGIVVLFLREFGALVALAFVVAAPAVWFGAREWLAGFAYQTEVGLLPFLAAGLGALAVMVIAVSSQSLRAAFANPVDSLRDE
ncbi:MAG: putative ABC transport system permease protein [Rhodothermales bacterium]|jgi:putative ABC transport system permease protein